MNNGFPSNNVYMSMMDRQGYIWFATDNGVVKYNGYNFKVFTTADGLPKNDVWKLYEDDQGRMYVFTNTNHFGYIRDNVYHDVTKGNTFALNSFFDDWHRKLIFSSSDNVSRWLHAIVNDSVYSITFPLHNVYHILATGSKIYSFVLPDGVYCYDLQHPLKRPEFICKFHTNIVSFLDDHVFCWAYHGHFYTRGGGSSELIGIWDPEKCNFLQRDLELLLKPDEHLHSFMNVEDSILVFTNKRILNLSDSLNFGRSDYLSFLHSNTQFSYRSYVPEFGCWYCTTSAGAWGKQYIVNIFQRNDAMSILAKTSYIGNEGDSIQYWFDSDVLYATMHGKIAHSWHLSQIGKLQSAISFDSNHLLLSFNYQLVLFDKRTGAIKDFIHQYKRIYFRSVDSTLSFIIDTSVNKEERVFHMPSNDMLLSSSLYLAGHNTFFKVNTQADTLFVSSFGGTHFLKIVPDEKGKFYWLFNTESLSAYDVQHGKLIDINKSVLALFKIGIIKSLKIDNYGNIYLLHDGKLSVYNIRNLTYADVALHLNLSDVQIEIQQNQLFIAGVFGVVKATLTKNGVIRTRVWVNNKKRFYNRVYNLICTATHEVILQTDKGIFQSNFEAFDNTALLNINNKHFYKFAFINTGNQNRQLTDTIQFTGYNHITLEAINYYGYGTPLYSYRIDEFDSGWAQNKSGEIYFNNVPPGKYYKLRCKVADDFWDSGTKVFLLYKIPRWYQTAVWKLVFWIAGILAFVIIIVLVVIITRYYVARTNEKKRALTELELRAVYSQLNPHFIFNTLNSALYFIDRKKFDEAYMHVSKFSKLLRAYLKSSQQRLTLLSDEIEMLTNYVELQKTRFEETFEYLIEVDNKLPIYNVQIPSLLLQPLVENAINHGIFHKGGKGLLQIKFLQGKDNTELLCIIEDNGVGRIRAHEINKANSNKKESYGTKLTNQLMEIFKEFEKLDISLSYTDKAYPESGTIVTVTIKNIQYEA